MRLAHLKAADRPLAVVKGDRVAPLAVDGIATVEPGDVILTGTPWGVGGFRDPPVFLRPGDTVEVEVEGIGVLANDVGRNTT